MSAQAAGHPQIVKDSDADFLQISQESDKSGVAEQKGTLKPFGQQQSSKIATEHDRWARFE